jgi:hypothetical protein
VPTSLTHSNAKKLMVNGLASNTARSSANVAITALPLLFSLLFHNALHAASAESISLQDHWSNEGVEVRILLAECAGPAHASYTLEAASMAMQLMDTVLHNRRNDPDAFMASGAKNLVDIVRAKGQFQGFEAYPHYSSNIKKHIEDLLHIANNPSDRRNGDYAAFVNKAVEIAKSDDYADPSPGKLVAWRAAGSGSPGHGFIFYKTVLGNDFYYQM